MSQELNIKIIVKIDMRETGLFQLCKNIFSKHPHSNEINVVSENLPIGDIIIADNTDEKIIIERKTLSDLAASIKDGRYTEQSYRLDGISHHNHNIIYLIEGDMTKYNIFKAHMDKETLYSAMFSINYYKGFSVMRSNSIDETALMICNMVYKILKSDKPSYYINPKPKPPKPTTDDTSTDVQENNNVEEQQQEQEEEQQDTKNYCKVVKKVKKDNITAENIGEIMLCQIPGVSSVTALAVLGKFDTLPKLIMAIQEDENCLKDISSTNTKGQVRKISKSCIQNIIQFLK
jgi:ERCC4-type nuclease